ncbi:hypothetical protein M2322_000822 [Rhodoblastus acidophilus]|uniref:hypothetical protein n=1 Tax=Rhodoblastus acidophilus TaxID=1074 RepID=UPI002224AFF6|nr:hypothetical protein [Rhodoblastus acidophilus]MCW2315288.1 hypothetical protein [Rhodoblastus acidophilus]
MNAGASEDEILARTNRLQQLIAIYFASSPPAANDELEEITAALDAAPVTSSIGAAARIVSAAWQTGIAELFPESGQPETSARWRPLRALVAEARRTLGKKPPS